MKKPFFYPRLPLLLFFLQVIPSPSISTPTVTVKEDAWASPAALASCTMCASCDNPCPSVQYPPPPPPVQSPPPPASSVNCPPPPSPPTKYSPPPPSSGWYPYGSPPPPASGGGGAGGYNPPPAKNNYPTPPPPNPILPYFPYYFYSPPPPSKFSAGSPRPLPFDSASVFLLFFPFLLFL